MRMTFALHHETSLAVYNKNESIPQLQSVKFLGVILDWRLTVC